MHAAPGIQHMWGRGGAPPRCRPALLSVGQGSVGKGSVGKLPSSPPLSSGREVHQGRAGSSVLRLVRGGGWSCPLPERCFPGTNGGSRVQSGRLFRAFEREEGPHMWKLICPLLPALPVKLTAWRGDALPFWSGCPLSPLHACRFAPRCGGGLWGALLATCCSVVACWSPWAAGAAWQGQCGCPPKGVPS